MRPVATSIAAVTTVAVAPFAAAALALKPQWRVGLGERLGGGVAPTAGAIWVHGASVGELYAALPLVDRLCESGRAVFVTSQTTAGCEAVQRARPEWPCRLAPLDHPWCVERALAGVRPAVIVLVETELWPVWIAAAARREIPVLVLSGRLSERSFARYRRALPAVRRTLGRLHAVGARTPEDAERFRLLGAPPDAVVVTGDLKLAGRWGGPPLAPELAAHLASLPLFVAGSTHAGEEVAVLRAFDQIERRVPRCALVIAPRQPRRFEEVAALVRDAGRVLRRRSALGCETLGAGEVLLLDSLGELAAVFGLACVAFVGGTLVPVGGQNIAEPALAGTPVLFGPHTKNVDHAAAILTANGAGAQVADADELGRVAAAWLAEPVANERRGLAGQRALAGHRGSVARSVALVERALAAQNSAAIS